jgi:hypothetical protein
MSNLQSLFENLWTAGTLYGWRIDAVLIGGLLWLLMTTRSWRPVLRPVYVLAHSRG